MAMVPAALIGAQLAKKKTLSKLGRKVPIVGDALGDLIGALGFAKSLRQGSRQFVGPRTKKGYKRQAKKMGRRRGNMNGNPPIVTANAAPVAFGRQGGWKPTFKISAGTKENGCKIHTVDYVGKVINPASNVGFTTSTGTLGAISVFPTSTALFPFTSQFAQCFAKYRLLKLKLHYEHFTSTATQGEIILQFFPDPDYDNGAFTSITEVQSQNAGNYMSGACYEDFSKEFDLTAIGDNGAKTWFDNFGTVATGADGRENTAGELVVFVNNFTSGTTAVSTGNVWVEALWEFHERKLASITVGVDEYRLVMDDHKMSRDMKEKLLYRIIVDALDKSEEQKKRITQEKEKVNPIEGLLTKYNMLTLTPELKSTSVVPRKGF